MKLFVRKLWFPHDVDETIAALFRIPQMREKFDDGFIYDGEMRPRGIKLFTGYWPADAILARLPSSDKDVYLVLTSLSLKGDYGAIHGKGYDRRAIVSNNSFLAGRNKDLFDTNDVDFQAIAFHEAGHALGLAHHDHSPPQPCEMFRSIRTPSWPTLDDIRFCNDCYQRIK